MRKDHFVVVWKDFAGHQKSETFDSFKDILAFLNGNHETNPDFENFHPARTRLLTIDHSFVNEQVKS